MNTNEIELRTYTEILRFRKVFKDFQQYSWNVAKLENKYSIDTLTQEEAEALIQFYKDTLNDVLDHFTPKLMELRANSLPKSPEKGGRHEN